MKNNQDYRIDPLDNKKDEMNILDHLDELRRRIIICIVAIIIFSIASYFKSSQLAALIKRPLGDIDLVYITPIEGFVTNIKIAVFGGLLISSPIIFLQTLLFISPGLYKREKIILFSMLPAAVLLFLGGAYFSFAFILPITLNYLMSFGAGVMTPMLSAGAYYSFVIMFIVGLGLVFELPMVLLVLSKFGIVNYIKLAKKRKYIILIITVLSALITPPDIISQIGIALPLIVLFEISLLFMYIFDKLSYHKEENISQ
jgi:sec-independent protein translocase protein TatC